MDTVFDCMMSLLDQAFLSRLPYRLYIPLPTLEERMSLFKHMLKEQTMDLFSKRRLHTLGEKTERCVEKHLNARKRNAMHLRFTVCNALGLAVESLRL